MAKVLLVAFQACPGMGSEAGIGWNFALGLCRRHDVTLLTTREYRRETETWLAEHPGTPLRVLYHNSFLPRGPMVRSYPTANLLYYSWQLRIIPLVRRLQREHQFDLVHHVNWGRYWMAAGAAFSGAPFVWGPVGAAEGPPPALRNTMGPRGRLAERVRDLTRWLFWHDPLARLTARRARCAIAATRETETLLRDAGVREVTLIPSVGIGDEDMAGAPGGGPSPEHGYAFASVGRLLEWKGFHLGLEAFAAAHLPPEARFAVAGEGPELGRLKALAARLGIAERVDFLGMLPRARCLELLARSRALVHPSLHDSGGFVLVEAMAQGRPVLCLDIGGPGVIVDERSGVRVPAPGDGSAAQVIAGLRDGMRRLWSDDEYRATLSAGALSRARSEFPWSRKMEQIDAVYARVLARPAEPLQRPMTQQVAA